MRNPEFQIKKGRKLTDFDAEQLKKGIEVELEHTDDRVIAREIAMDHLEEDRNYYKKLARMEAKGVSIGDVFCFAGAVMIAIGVTQVLAKKIKGV